VDSVRTKSNGASVFGFGADIELTLYS
jgi:hypothetical protein